MNASPPASPTIHPRRWWLRAILLFLALAILGPAVTITGTDRHDVQGGVFRIGDRRLIRDDVRQPPARIELIRFHLGGVPGAACRLHHDGHAMASDQYHRATSRAGGGNGLRREET
jgi:hypothetical protein